MGQFASDRAAGVPRRWSLVSRACALIAGLALAIPSALAARDAGPSIRIPLNPIGYQSILRDILASGTAMMTVHFADTSHLLVTFGVKRLIKREPGDPPDDYDRMIAAFLLELPTGKVVAHTEWRAHDRGQYLWDIGDGRFLVRVRDHLSMIQPCHEPSPANAFHEYSFLHIQQRVLAIFVSPDHDLLTVESGNLRNQDSSDARSDSAPAPVEVNFYRMKSGPNGLEVSVAGGVRSRVPVLLPLNASGILNAVESGRDRWKFHYSNTVGKVNELAQWDTSCYPHTTFVSRTEFVAFGCRGSVDRQTVAGFSLNGDFMWQQSFFENYAAPSFSVSPHTGRFALSRLLITPGASVVTDLSSSEITGQEVRVYQTYNGKVIFHTTCVPAMRSGQNFALSPDGMHLAVLRETPVFHKATKEEDAYTDQQAAIEIYDLPELSKQDLAAVSEADRWITGPSDGRMDQAIKLAEGSQTPPSDTASAAATPALPPAPTPIAAPVADAPDTPPPSPEGVSGDQQTGPRTPPTLYAPGEQPESGSKKKN